MQRTLSDPALLDALAEAYERAAWRSLRTAGWPVRESHDALTALRAQYVTTRWGSRAAMIQAFAAELGWAEQQTDGAA